ncbi:hypothetical protein VMCG_02760 [Cytospora schulzeri]|uniref:Heterokaryon incompatibility domain-containing protein n=1 Tax=Cytospora schulzeri TaxID=448051 RepID=A0A423WZQ2_9PEZI|nr:hypothetical protein VMCG_02760 [Valsa malicola]
MAPEQGMDSDMSPQRLTINNDIYELVSTAVISREQRSRVSKYNDPELKYMKPYKFDRLHSMRRRIRLLRLHGGGLSNPEITCELFEVEYDKDNHNIVRKASRETEYSHRAKRRKYNEPLQQPVTEDQAGREASDYDDIVEYEALSWCWGTENKDCAIRIKKGGEYYRLAVTKELSLALKYLRHGDGDRILWIDAMCIDQENHEERNHQVQMMARIYTGAKQACIWLGEDNDDSTKAIHFIREIMRLENFDSISENKENASKWQSLLILMQRPWFSRRWVVQEIALAKSATIYCGNDQIAWENFAVAVELFVEVETATHRLSEVMRKDEKFGHVPQWFEHVSELGASVLVQATGKVFRRDGTHRNNLTDDTESKIHGRRHNQQSKSSKRSSGALAPSSSSKSSDWTPQRPLLSLEYLVSSLTVFEASQPRDAVYSLLAIARDTAPLAELQTVSADGSEEAIIMSTVSSFLERKPFKVDYSRPYSDVCKDFISSCIAKSGRSDPTKALDILCRPWAPDADETPGNVLHKKPVQYRFLSRRQQREPLWKSKQNEKFRVVVSYDPSDVVMQISNPEERIGAPTTHRKIPDHRSMKEYWEDCEKVWKQYGYDTFEERVQPYLPDKPNPPKDSDGSFNQDDTTFSDSEKLEDEHNNPDQDIDLPSWVSRISGASFALYRLPGMKQGGRIGRQNADPLVGSPQEGHRNYSAAQNTKVEFRSDRRLRFRKRPGPHQNPGSGHCSLYTEGFILTEIDMVAEPARLGGIPKTWTQIAGWDHAVDGETEPPAEFWRTLVADRGKDNRNPPYYYATACKESVRKGGLRGGSVDTGALISSERNSIIAEFCRRVQAVIWNRRLIRTKGPPRVLGLASEHVQKGDLVCIVHGCTVPVILRKHGKDEKDLEVERMQDAIQSMKAVLSICEEACFRKIRYRKQLQREREKNPELETTWKREVQEELKEVNRELKDLRNQEDLARKERQKRDEQQKRRKKEAELRIAIAKAARERAEKAGKRPSLIWQRSTTMPVTGLASMTGGLHTMLSADEAEAGPGVLTDVSGQLGDERSGGPSQRPRRSRPVGDNQGPDGSQAPEEKSKEQADREEEERKRQERKDKAKEEDPKRWYKFIGEAYIHGMMDGEAVRLQINEGIPLRMFEIR